MSDVKEDTVFQRVALSPRRLLKKPTGPKADPLVPTTPINESDDPHKPRTSDDETPEEDTFESEIDDVILVRKLASVGSLRGRRMAVLRQLEVVSIARTRMPFADHSGSRQTRPEGVESGVQVQSEASRLCQE